MVRAIQKIKCLWSRRVTAGWSSEVRTWSESVASQRRALGAGWKLGPERRRFSQHVCGQGIVRSGNEWKIISGKNIEGKRMAEIGSTV